MINRVLLCLVLVGSVHLAVSAQDDPSSDLEPHYFYVEINAPHPNNESDLDVGTSNFTPAYFEMLRDTLQAEGMNPIFVVPALPGVYPDIFQTTGETEGWDEHLFDNDNPILPITIESHGEDDWVNLSPFGNFQWEPLPVAGYGVVAIPIISRDADNLEAVVAFTAGIALYMHHDCEAALPYLEAASDHESFVDYGFLVYESAYFYRASCEYVLGRPEQAIELYRLAMELTETIPEGSDPRLMTDYSSLNLAWVYAQSGQTQEALEVLDAYQDMALISYSIKDFERFWERSKIYLLLEEEEAAINEMTRIIEIATEHNGELIDGKTVTFSLDETALLLTERGWLYAQIGQFEEALADYSEALMLDPEYPKAYYRRGQLYIEQDDSAAALEDFTRFLELAPDYFSSYDEDLAPYIEQAEQFIHELSETSN